MTDKEIEQMWKDFENVIFNEDEDGEFILSKNWKYFGKGTLRSDVWSWFDEHHSKGVGFLSECFCMKGPQGTEI